jgi:hypothetical protein
MNEMPRPYTAYLLRLWQVPGPGPATWRASLEDPHTGERLGFGSLDDLVGFLRELIGDGNRRTDDTQGGVDEM